MYVFFGLQNNALVLLSCICDLLSMYVLSPVAFVSFTYKEQNKDATLSSLQGDSQLIVQWW